MFLKKWQNIEKSNRIDRFIRNDGTLYLCSSIDAWNLDDRSDLEAIVSIEGALTERGDSIFKVKHFYEIDKKNVYISILIDDLQRTLTKELHIHLEP